jgi:ADP-glucose pyrophosphorylase
MGIYLFRRQVLEELLQDKNPGGTGRQDEHFGYDVIPHALRSGAKVPRACVSCCSCAWLLA